MAAADLSPVYDALRAADAAGDTAGAAKLAAYIKSQAHPVQQFDAVGGNLVPTGSPQALAAQTPTSDMSGTQKFLAGAGKATMDLGRGAGQDLGLVSRADVADSRAFDAPLMKTGAGKWGYGIGTAVDLLPAAFIPGASTLAGSAAIGAGMGLLQPSTSTGETLGNVGMGAAASPLSILGGRAAGSLYQGGKAAIEPLLAGGQQRVAARAMQSFAGDPNAAVSSLLKPQDLLPGVQPTTAELANNAGLSQLERTLRNNPEYANALTQRNQGNRAAMTGAINELAGTPQQMQATMQARSSMSSPLYKAASQAQVPGDDQLANLLGRPSMQSAWRRAQQLAAENGEPLVSGVDAPEQMLNSSVLDASGKPYTSTIPATTQTYSGKAIQYLKMGINDIANTAEQKGMGVHEQTAVNSSRAALNKWISAKVPALKAADDAYAGGSIPINQMQVGGALADKLQPALSDFGNNTRLNAASYAGAVRNGDQLATQVTGQENSSLGAILSSAQMKVVRQVGDQLARRANADELGRAVGSNTGQNLISQNVLRQVLGPMGLPQSMGERAAQSALGQSLLRPVQWAAKAGEPRVMDVLAQAALDPQMAARLLRMPQGSTAARALWARQGLLGPLGNTAGQGLLGNSAQ